MSNHNTTRNGLLAAGNFIIDHVKTIDAFPEQDMLVNITADTSSNGGGPYNVLKDLSKLGAPFPLAAAGLVGTDPAGDTILDDLADHGIDTTAVLRTGDAPTSYTDAMTVAATGRRTFFHHRGTNALLDTHHLVPEIETSHARLFYLGYLMLLDTLDAIQPDRSTNAATVLAHASCLGFTTVVDLVSVDHPDFANSVRPSLPHTDILFLNEREAALVLGRDLPEPDAARAVLDLGVRQLVVLHSPAGAVAVSRSGATTTQASLSLPPDFVTGATGAGDAFSAGCLHSLHEAPGDIAAALHLGVCTAAASLAHPTPSGGILPAADCLGLANRFPPISS